MVINNKDKWIAEEAAKQNPKKILDIGYAQYPNTDITKLGAEVYGVDLVNWPAPEYKKTYICDLNSDVLPFEDGEIDVVTMGCTLAHIAKPLRLLADINRILAPNGVLILTSTNPHYYWENVINIFFNRFKKRVSKSKHVEHFFEFTRYTMRTILNRAGFTLEKEIGSTLQIVKTKIRINVAKLPGLAFEIIYIARKTHKPEGFAIIEDDKGKIVNLKTDLFN